MKTILLKEYDTIEIGKGEKCLYEQDFIKLKNFILENEKINATQFLKLTTKNKREVLQAQNFVGVIQLNNKTTIEILPKITNLENNIEETRKIFLKMLKSLKNYPFKNFQIANIKSNKVPIFEIFIEMFLDELDRLVKKGIKSDYINIEENQKFLKGKLLIKEQLKYNFIHKERFFVSYDEYLPDRIENRIIKTTLKKLYKISASLTNKQNIRKFLFIFDEVKPLMHVGNLLKNLKIDRTIKYYEIVLSWCKVFLLQKSFTPFYGKEVAFALLFDMNKLFESYVGSIFKKNLKKEVILQHKKHFVIDEPKRFRLIPDIVINNGEFIFDTKWKLLDSSSPNNNISQSDVYQMLAYASKYSDCKSVYLVYPFVENVKLEKYKINFHNRQVKLIPIFFDLKRNYLIRGK